MVVVCRLFGHRHDARSMACTRCGLTDMEIELGKRPAPTWGDVDAAYWKGIADGRLVDRKRAYRVGFMRGGRDVFARVRETLLS